MKPLPKNVLLSHNTSHNFCKFNLARFTTTSIPFSSKDHDKKDADEDNASVKEVEGTDATTTATITDTNKISNDDDDDSFSYRFYAETRNRLMRENQLRKERAGGSTKEQREIAKAKLVPNRKVAPRKLPGMEQFGIQEVIKYLVARKVEDVRVYDVSTGSIHADYWVCVTAASSRAVGFIGGEVCKIARAYDLVADVEGNTDEGWIIAQVGAVWIHLFTEEGRAENPLVEDQWREVRIADEEFGQLTNHWERDEPIIVDRKIPKRLLKVFTETDKPSDNMVDLR